jgi:hypothetical protein
MIGELTVQEIIDLAKQPLGAAIKYVRIDDEFRYALANGYVEHRDLVEDDEKAKSAGFFLMFYVTENRHIQVIEIPSTSLKLGSLPEDESLLKMIFQ